MEMMIKKNLIPNSILIILAIFLSTSLYVQTLSFDTLKNGKKFEKYIDLSKEMMLSVKNNKIFTLNQYLKKTGTYEKKNLSRNLSYVHQILKNGSYYFIKSVVLESYIIPFSDNVFKKQELRITYSIGKNSCTSPMFDNTITFIFFDVAKEEENVEFEFQNCKDNEAIKKAILNIPVPPEK